MPRPEISSGGHGMALCLAEELRAERDCHDFITVTISLLRRKFQRHMKLRLLKRARLSLSHCLRQQPTAIRKPALKKCRRPRDTVHALGQVGGLSWSVSRPARTAPIRSDGRQTLTPA